MKNVLILSCSTGQGHNSCGQALEQHFQERGVSCRMRDALEFNSPRAARFISWGHSTVYRHMPGLFRWGYRYSEKHPGVLGPGSPAYSFLTAGADSLAAFIGAEGFDTVICTHIFASVLLTRAMREHHLELMTAFVATDYTCSPGTGLGEADWFFIPDPALKPEFIRGGVPAERIVPAGIPLRRGFTQRTDKADAKRLVGIRPDRAHLLVMCGSMGCGPMVKLVGRIARHLPSNAEVTVVCGTNRCLKRRLTRRFAPNGQIHIQGYTNQMPLYMDAADLYLTKPGGISVTEAAAKGLPMAFINAVDGCEGYNRKFFLGLGGAVTADTTAELAEACIRILNSPEERREMERALTGRRPDDAVGEIFRTMNGGAGVEQRKYG